jgi:hypothetical protein
MKAAAEAWGTNLEDFRRGFAKQTDYPEIIAATMAKPVVTKANWQKLVRESWRRAHDELRTIRVGTRKRALGWTATTHCTPSQISHSR